MSVPHRLQLEESKAFAVGHLALGYLLSKASAKLLKTELNIPLVLTLSILPDIDLLIPFIRHRGPTHSLIITLIVFIPIFAIYHKEAAPYLVALVSHSAIGDYITGQTQLLWPITTQAFGTGMDVTDPTNLTLELLLFLAAIIILLKTKDHQRLFKACPLCSLKQRQQTSR